jgi:hypothetical protein
LQGSWRNTFAASRSCSTRRTCMMRRVLVSWLGTAHSASGVLGCGSGLLRAGPATQAPLRLRAVNDKGFGGHDILSYLQVDALCMSHDPTVPASACVHVHVL